MIVVSDLVGTLTTGFPVRGVVSWVRHKQSAARANLYILSFLPNYALAKAGLINMQDWAHNLMRTALNLVKNPTEHTISEITNWTLEEELWPGRRKDVLERLSEHRRRGAQVTIASSAYEPAVRAFADRIGVQAIGSPIELIDGRIQFATRVVARENKIERVLGFLGVSRIDVAYGDTEADIPLLENADSPVAVYPDKILRSTAIQRGWEIIDAAGE